MIYPASDPAKLAAHDLADHLRAGPRWLDAACARRNMGGRGGRRFSGGGRRAVPFSPTDVAGLAAWYRETYAGGTWSDLSGNGRDLTTLAGTPSQTTRAGQLAISLNGSAALQGAFGATLTQPTTVYVVWEATGVAATQVIYDGNDATNRIFEYINTTGPSVRAGAPTELTGGTPSAAQIYASCIIANSSSSSFFGRSNFATAGATGNAGTSSLDGLTVGARGSDAGLKFTGYVWEIAVYSGAHDAATRKKIGDYLTARYSGLTVTT